MQRNANVQKDFKTANCNFVTDSYVLLLFEAQERE